MSLSAAQKARALSLYRRLLKAGQTTFAGDQRVIAGWHDKIRTSFAHEPSLVNAGSEAVEAKLNEWEDVITVLKHNVVQGRIQPETGAYSLRFTPDTELGSNESIKQARKQQLESLVANKGPSCRSGQNRAFSSLAMGQWSSRAPISLQQRAFSSSSQVCSKVSSRQLPSPVPHFPTTVILADGSSIQMHTTSPRHVTKLTRDVTNHPLWNPALERRGAGKGGSEAEVGRLGRFRRRFEQAQDASAGASSASAEQGAAAQGEGMRFSEDDLAWMSVGGRQARAGTPISKSKAKKK